MKTLSLLAAFACLSTLAACQSSSVSSAPTTVEPAGTQARYSIEVPGSSGAPAAAQPYALQGYPAPTAMPAPGTGYQAR